MRLRTTLLSGIWAAASAAGAMGFSPGEEVAEDILARDQRLHLKALTFDPIIEAVALSAEFRREFARETTDDSPRIETFIVQFDHPVSSRDRRALKQLGLRRVEYLPHQAYLVRGSAPARRALAEQPGVRAVIPFHPAFRVDPTLLEAHGTGPAETLEVAVFLLPEADPISATAALVTRGIELLDWDDPRQDRFHVRLRAEQLPDLCRVPEVHWVEPRARATQRFNNETNWVVQSNTEGSTPAWDHGIRGDGVIIGHIDGGIDVESCFFTDAEHPIGPDHRKIVSFHGDINRRDNHGTHTAGTAAGDRQPTFGATGSNGIADHARLAHTSLSEVSSTNLRLRLLELYEDGARVFTNSWGNDGTTEYNAWSRDIDRFAWENQDALPVWAVTNGFTLRNPENAKNCLAVGATFKPEGQRFACSGGTGPTADGRRKPEIFAPGCGVKSARIGGCSTLDLSGTSMATPAVAGAAALAVQYLEEGWYPTGTPRASDGFTPSGALVKAMLINAAVDMAGEPGYPSEQEGWGRLNLSRSLFFPGDSRRSYLIDIPRQQGLADPGEVHEYAFEVLSDERTLEVTLSFYDKQASTSASYIPVNDIDLTITAPDSTEYRGNVLSDAWSVAGGSHDPLNNVERVRLRDPAPGMYRVSVRAVSVTTGRNQMYALAMSGDLRGVEDGRYQRYGTGLAGAGGFAPTLQGAGIPNAGEAIAWEIHDGLGGAAGQLLFSLNRDSIPFRGGQILVQPPWFSLPFVLEGDSGVPGAGHLAFSANLGPGAIGAILDGQALVSDPLAPNRVSLSNGLEMTVGQSP